MGRTRRRQPTIETGGPPPPEDLTYTVDELAAAAGVPVRTVRYYVEQEVVPAPVFRSWYTRYGRDHLLRLRATVLLRKQRLRLAAIRVRLAAVTPEELLQLAGYVLPPPPAPDPPADPVRALAVGFLGRYRAAGQPSERWEHIPICPGVQLLVRSEADGEAWRVAREIVATFGAVQGE